MPLLQHIVHMMQLEHNILRYFIAFATAPLVILLFLLQSIFMTRFYRGISNESSGH